MEELKLSNFFEDFDIIENVKKILNIKNNEIMASFIQKQKQLNKLVVKEKEEQNIEEIETIEEIEEIEKENIGDTIDETIDETKKENENLKQENIKQEIIKQKIKEEKDLKNILLEERVNIVNIFEYLEELINNYVVNTELRKCYSDLDFIDLKLYDNYYIGSNVSFGDNVIIMGPVVIGDNVKIGNNVVIRPYSIISNNVSIGNGSEIKCSYLLPNSKVASNCFVGDSIVGMASRIGSGVVTANRRFDQRNIKIKSNISKQNQDKDFSYSFDTMRAFLGTIIGNKTRLGANVTTLPGTLIGFNSLIYPGVVVNKNVPSNTRVKLIQNLEFVENKK